MNENFNERLFQIFFKVRCKLGDLKDCARCRGKLEKNFVLYQCKTVTKHLNLELKLFILSENASPILFQSSDLLK